MNRIGKWISYFSLVFNLGCSNSATQFDLPQINDQFSGQIFYNNKVDILFVVDNSKSMLQYQQRLAARLPDLINTLNKLGVNYRVAVTSTTMSLNTSSYPMSRSLLGNPVYLTAANIHLLTDRIILGESGSDVERGLDSMKYVLSSEYLNSVHSDFLRQDALLSVIFISDEIDQSNEFGNPNSNDFVNFLNQIKPAFLDGTRSWVANYIGILSTQSCDLLGGQVALGTQFLKLVHASQGVSSSICAADLSLAVSNIKARLVDQITAYRFLDQPNKSTVQVTIAGRAIHESAVSGWTLETEIGALGQILYVLKFHGDAIPAANEKVDVSYKPAGVS